MSKKEWMGLQASWPIRWYWTSEQSCIVDFAGSYLLARVEMYKAEHLALHQIITVRRSREARNALHKASDTRSMRASQSGLLPAYSWRHNDLCVPCSTSLRICPQRSFRAACPCLQAAEMQCFFYITIQLRGLYG